jgi:hypothetical protein
MRGTIPAELAAVLIVTVTDVAPPERLTLFEDNVQVLFGGAPLQLSVIDPGKLPPSGAILTGNVADEPD